MTYVLYWMAGMALFTVGFIAGLSKIKAEENKQ